MQIITTRHLFMMGATSAHMAVLRRVPLLIRWDETGYALDGAITARRLNASQVLRCIMALKTYKT